MSHWRNAAAPIIREIIQRVGIENEKALRKEISAAYPFGERDMHPYTIWLSEVKRQINDAKGMARLNYKPKPLPAGQTCFDDNPPLAGDAE